jgi:hypothetical protein
MEYVVSLGGKPDLVSAQGFGDSNPVASNDTAQGRAQNRRVELSLAGSLVARTRSLGWEYVIVIVDDPRSVGRWSTPSRLRASPGGDLRRPMLWG